MCGIAGFIGTSPRLTREVLQRMCDAQAHRGPDDTGIEYHEIAQSNQMPLRMGMAHNRLSILDLSAAGHQPMATPDRTAWICYNGEFYNSPDQRQLLQQAGVSFRSSSDTEVLLHLCQRAGVRSAVQTLNGMFAFGFFDTTQQTLTLARDRAGQKPLFYALLPDGSLLYASELPALLASGLIDRSDRDPQAFDQYWTMGFTAAERTFYAGIRRLRPGHLAVWRQQTVKMEAYWQIQFDPVEDDGRSIDDCVDELLTILADAVKVRLLSDVPVAVCLSGGIDSTLISLMISRLRADVPAYTIAFENAPNDEAAAAAAIADHLRLPHRVLKVTGNLSAEFPRIAGWYGEPFGDASSIPMYYLSRLIREHATVALTGDGGDELFGGYHHYRQGLQIWQPGTLGPSGDWRGLRNQARRLFLRGLGVPRGYARLQRQINPRIKKIIYGKDVWAACHEAEVLQERSQWCKGASDAAAAMQNCDFHVYMTDDVLAKVDRMSMAHSLECRSPFMDPRVIEWAARLPLRARIHHTGQGKWILRQLLSRYLPATLYDRPKQGFTPPWERWCEGDLRRQLRSDWMAMQDPWVRPEAIDRLVPEQGPISPVLSWLAYAYVQGRQASA